MRNNNIDLVFQRLVLWFLCLMSLSSLQKSTQYYVDASTEEANVGFTFKEIVAELADDVVPVQQKQVDVDVVVVGLEQKFAIQGPLSYGHDLYDFSLDFLVSDFIDDDMVGYTIFDGLECSWDDNENIVENSGYLLSELIPDNSTGVGDGSGTRTMEISLSLNPDLIVNSTIYSPYENENDYDSNTTMTNDTDVDSDIDTDDSYDGDRGIIEICLRFSNYNADKDSLYGFQVNFVDNPIVIVLDMTGDLDMEEFDMEIAESTILKVEKLGIAIVMGGGGGVESLTNDTSL